MRRAGHHWPNYTQRPTLLFRPPFFCVVGKRASTPNEPPNKRIRPTPRGPFSPAFSCALSTVFTHFSLPFPFRFGIVVALPATRTLPRTRASLCGFFSAGSFGTPAKQAWFCNFSAWQCTICTAARVAYVQVVGLTIRPSPKISLRQWPFALWSLFRFCGARNS